MLTMRCCLPKGEISAEAGVILRPEIFAKEKLRKSASKPRPALLLCALFMAGLLSLSWEAQGALEQDGRGWSVLMTYRHNASHKGRQGHIRRSSTEKKRHPRFRKARTHRRLRARRPYAKVAARHGAPPARKHARHIRRARYHARKSPGPRVSSARAGRTRFKKTRTLASQGARPRAGRPLVAGVPTAKQPLKGKALASGALEQAPGPAAGAVQALAVALSSDGRISANVNNRPLGEMLRLMVEKHLFEIQGPLPRSALSIPVTMAFSGLTLDEIFEKMMRGYNYAFIREDVSDKRVLIVLGEIKRVAYKDLVSPAHTPRHAERMSQQSGPVATVAVVPQAAGQPSAVQGRRPTILRQPGRMTPGPVHGGETPRAPSQEQKGQGQQGLAKPGTAAESGASTTPPNAEGGSAVQEERPPDRSTLGSF